MAQIVELADRGGDAVMEKLRSIAGKLEAEATKRISQRHQIEQRWLEDLEQFYGLYDRETRSNLGTNNSTRADSAIRSKVFMNRTRPKTEAMAARLIDLLFPTDDRNWGIQPTPVPELTGKAEEAYLAQQKLREQMKALQEQQEAAAAQEQGQVDPAMLQQMKEMEAQAQAVETAIAELDAAMGEARKRAELMENEISDQLNECLYNAVMRDVIEDACKLGTGICKGPVTGDKIRKGWKKVQLATQGGQMVEDYELQHSDTNQPAMRRVDPWSFFPDMSVRDIKDGEGPLERHLMNAKQLRQFAKHAGVDQQAVRRLLRAKSTTSAPSYVADLRNLNDASVNVTDQVYHVWEYTGCIDAEDMAALAEAFGDQSTLQEMQDIDPLVEVNAVIWFCQGEILKFGIYPYDSGEPIYSVFNLLKDETTAFGYGVPWMMRDPQRAVNAAWRAMLDNGGLSAGPQIVVAKGMIEPADGDWRMAPRKVWIANESMPPTHKAFDVHNIPSAQVELAGIIQMSEKEIDEMTALPKLAQGEQGAGVTKTAQGMSILMNSANVVFRRIVKNFDDDVTTPNIRRFYDFNMQHSKKAHIKGDYNIDARGSSVLLVREMQSQNLLALAMQFSGHPVYGPMLKDKEMLRMVFKAFMVPADQVMLSDQEISTITAKAEVLAKQMAEQMAQQTGGKPAEIWQQEIDLKREELQTKVRLAEFERETVMMQLAEKMNMSLDALQAKLQMNREKLASDERRLAVETAVTQKIGPSAGGMF